METRDIYNKYFKNAKPLKMTKANLDEWKQTNVCHICEKAISDSSGSGDDVYDRKKLKITVISQENIGERLIKTVI